LRLALTLALMLATLAFGFAGCKDQGGSSAAPGGSSAPVEEPEAAPVAEEYRAFVEAVDTDWAYDLAVEVCEGADYQDNELGDRQAGSDAEHRTADKIASVMEEIGLEGVTKDPVAVDRIQANGSSVTVDGVEGEIVLHAYQTVGTPEGGLEAEIVDAGEGTIWDYEDLDVEGKIVLIDIDQWENWWIGTPATQALELGAAALIANNVSGFSEVATDAYNANDFCGPADLPTVSITQDDAARIREAMTDGVVGAKLVVGNDYSKGGGESYNVYGRIPGKDSSEAILFGAHYDAYFQGFQDDTIAWTGVLAIAKAMIDSGYTPQRDIIFMCHGAEEWGEADTNYDWAIGSYRQITEAHPDWQGKLVSFINFELSAYEFADYTYTNSSPESYGMLAMFTEAEGTPKPDGVYAGGILTDGFQTYTYDDSFSYYVAGVPSFINGMLLDVQAEEPDKFPFYYEIYHTNYDTKETYNEAVFDWQLKFYGSLGIHIDLMPAVELDFTGETARLTEALDADSAAAAGLTEEEIAAYTDAVAAFDEAANTLAMKTASINERYAQAETDEEKAALYEEAKPLNEANLALFKKTVDGLLGLEAETPIVPHEWFLHNVLLIDETVGYLEEGDVVSAADETGWQVNGGGEWYAMNFSEETAAHGDGAYLGTYASLNWGTGKTYEFADVSDATRSITERYEEEGGDYAAEIAIYTAARESQAALLKAKLAEEAALLEALAEEMRAL
jgi:hypothetical protein